jgi:hypothetical protein
MKTPPRRDAALRRPAGRPGPAQPSRLADLLASDDGKISMSALFVALAFFVTIGFVGNAEMTVFRKLEAQNAADSMALTCSTWRARGLNAVTANNHLMGELAAVVVLVESLGGPELDGQKEPATDSKDINAAISNPALGELGAFAGKAGGTTYDLIVPVWGLLAESTGFHDIDEQYVKELHEIFVDDDGGTEGDQDAGATIYDGKMTMKVLVWYGFGTKAASNAVYVAVSVLSLGTLTEFAEAANLAVHLAMDVALIAVVKDWYLTKGVEVFATMLRPLRDPALPLALRGLSLYGDSVADGVHVRSATEADLAESRQEFGVESYKTFPLMADFKLPVRAEEPPQGSDAGASLPPSLSTLEREEPEVAEAIKLPIRSVEDTLDTINDLIPDILDQDIDLGIVSGKSLDSRPLSQDEGGGYGFPGNPSLKHLREYAQQERLDWQAERTSQWVRATYPHVDELRRSLREFFSEVIPTSSMSTYYVHWTNRYTISVSHRLRADGERHLYVLEDGRPDAKGNERWTDDPPRAEELFAAQVFVKLKTPRAILTPPFFPNPNRKGLPAVAESLAYNANGRRVAGPTNLPGERQPDTGWDTLNWVPPVAAPEWGAKETKRGDMGRALSLFTAGTKLRADAASRVRLNWQAKLSPIGPDRLKAALANPEIGTFFERSGKSSLLPDPSMVLH